MSELTDFRKAKDDYFGKGQDSPLTAEERKSFGGLEYFPENPELKFVLELIETPDQEKSGIEIATSTGESVPHVRWGSFTFEVEGQEFALTVYRNEDGGDLFLPFLDATSGVESYGAGRYLDLVPAGDNRLLVDFNYAYNPYCAYNPHWSCPIPPEENRLAVAIRAGEMGYSEAVSHDGGG